jgi:hypothetical protein
MPPPGRPKIYRIVRVDRLASIISANGLFCDRRARQQGGGTVIGMNEIKDRRLTLPVSCHLGTSVGDYVPFYFCSRSTMLFVIRRANNPSRSLIRAASSRLSTWRQICINRSRGQTPPNIAGRSRYRMPALAMRFCSSVDDLGEINWQAVDATDFRQPDIKEGKQAEFLIHEIFPWALVDRIGVFSREIAQRVGAAMMGATHLPVVAIQRSWYY